MLRCGCRRLRSLRGSRGQGRPWSLRCLSGRQVELGHSLRDGRTHVRLGRSALSLCRRRCLWPRWRRRRRVLGSPYMCCFLQGHSTLSRGSSRLSFAGRSGFSSLLVTFSLRSGCNLVVIQVVIFKMSTSVFDQEVINRLFPGFPKSSRGIRQCSWCEIVVKGLLLAQQSFNDSFIRCSVPKRFQVTQNIRIDFLCIIHWSLDFIQTRWRDQGSARDLADCLTREPPVRKYLRHLNGGQSISVSFLPDKAEDSR